MEDTPPPSGPLTGHVRVLQDPPATPTPPVPRNRVSDPPATPPPAPRNRVRDLPVTPPPLWGRRLGDEAPYRFDNSRPAIPLRDQLITIIDRYFADPAITAQDGKFDQYIIVERARDDLHRFFIVAGAPSRLLPVLARHMSKAEAEIGFATCAYLNLIPKLDYDISSADEGLSAQESDNAESDNPRARKRRKRKKAAKVVRHVPQDYDDGLDDIVPGEPADVRALRFFARHSYQKQTGPRRGIDTTIYGTDLKDVLAKVTLLGDFQSLCHMRDFIQQVRSQPPTASAYSWVINETQSRNLYIQPPQAVEDLAISRQNVINVASAAWAEVKRNAARGFHFRLVRIITLVRLHLARKYYVDVFRKAREAAEAVPENELPIPGRRGRGLSTDAIEALFREVEPNLAAAFAHDNQHRPYKAGLSRFKESLKAGKRYMIWTYYQDSTNRHPPMPTHDVGLGILPFLADPRIPSTWMEQGSKSTDSAGMDCTGKTAAVIWYIQTQKPHLFTWARELSPWIHALFGHAPPLGLGEAHPIEGKSEDMLRSLADGEGLAANVPALFRTPTLHERDTLYFPGFSLPNHTDPFL